MQSVKYIFLLFVLNLQFIALNAEIVENDTLNLSNYSCCNNETFSIKKLIVPGAFVAVGIVTSIDYKNGINKEVNSWFKNNNSCKIDNYLRFVPSAAYLALGEFGIKSKHTFKERLAVFATSHVTMVALSYGFKAIVNEERPDASDCHSFPSGHVSTVFTGAELLREEYGTACGLAGYAVATTVGVLRLNNHKHWLGDVLTGAGIGILSARVGYWLLPFERRLFKWNKKDSRSIVSTVPTYDFISKSVGISLFAAF